MMDPRLGDMLATRFYLEFFQDFRFQILGGLSLLVLDVKAPGLPKGSKKQGRVSLSCPGKGKRERMISGETPVLLREIFLDQIWFCFCLQRVWMLQVSIPLGVTLLNLEMERKKMASVTSLGLANEELLSQQSLTGQAIF